MQWAEYMQQAELMASNTFCSPRNSPKDGGGGTPNPEKSVALPRRMSSPATMVDQRKLARLCTVNTALRILREAGKLAHAAGLPNPSHSRNAFAWSGPRKPTCNKSR